MTTTAAVQRLSRTANFVIFLGLLFTLLNLAATAGFSGLRQRGYGLHAVGLTLGIIGLGYGIRYGSRLCLALAMFLSVGFTLYVLTLLWHAPTLWLTVRLGLSLWAGGRLGQALLLFPRVRQEQAFPLPMSPYAAAMLRRFRTAR